MGILVGIHNHSVAGIHHIHFVVDIHRSSVVAVDTHIPVVGADIHRKPVVGAGIHIAQPDSAAEDVTFRKELHSIRRMSEVGKPSPAPLLFSMRRRPRCRRGPN